MTQIDQIKPPVATPQVFKVKRKKRPTRDSNREQRPSKEQHRSDDDRRDHIDEMV